MKCNREKRVMGPQGSVTGPAHWDAQHFIDAAKGESYEKEKIKKEERGRGERNEGGGKKRKEIQERVRGMLPFTCDLLTNRTLILVCL